MSKRYTRCGTCGALCTFASDNFRRANIKVSVVEDRDKDNMIFWAEKEIERLNKLLDASDKNEFIDSLTFAEAYEILMLKGLGYRLIKWSDLQKDR